MSSTPTKMAKYKYIEKQKNKKHNKTWHEIMACPVLY